MIVQGRSSQCIHLRTGLLQALGRADSVQSARHEYRLVVSAVVRFMTSRGVGTG